MSRRDFLQSLGIIAAALGLPTDALAADLAKSDARSTRLPVVWLQLQGCSGDTESFLRAAERRNPLDRSLTDPGIVELLLDVISLDYHETLMAPSGAPAERSLHEIVRQRRGKYLAVIEGSIPAGSDGIYCMIGGKTALSIAGEVCGSAAAVIALGSCAVSGGLPAASPNPTGAKSVAEAFPSLKKLCNLPGCPANVVNLVATIVHYIARGAFPPMDASKRPAFAYGKKVHDACFREDRREASIWGDSAYVRGGCLKRLGCKGEQARHNCPTVQWNGETSWCIRAGHICIGCTEDKFWDRLTPFYGRRRPGRRRG
jgi:hydrogenase small subunit